LIAKRGIEYGLQFGLGSAACKARTLFFLNSPHCLYLKKFCEFFQSYEKNERNAKGKLVFFVPDENEYQSSHHQIGITLSFIMDCHTKQYV
jgi:hypothetical protein